MGSLAHLSREEQIGLGVAAAAHVALVLALLWQVSDDPKKMPVPERMTVSLASEVSLRSTAPDPVQEAQASVAPELAPEPAPPPVPAPPQPRVEARPEPRPTQARVEARPQPQPTRAPAARPTAQPTQRPAPRPSAAPTRAAGGTRIGADFLQGAGATEGDRGTPAAAFGAAEQAALEQAINRQLKPHWSAPQGVDAEKLVTVLTWELNADGSLKGTPRLVSQSGVTDSNRPQASLHVERAIRAVQLAAPFNLPDQYYDKWKRIRTWRFDRRL
ncbi:MAG TPA: energy transducer TonB [Croceibacterium sp.]|nr:energy transducer TonB [Croceibacterium sp.]